MSITIFLTFQEDKFPIKFQPTYLLLVRILTGVNVGTKRPELFSKAFNIFLLCQRKKSTTSNVMVVKCSCSNDQKLKNSLSLSLPLSPPLSHSRHLSPPLATSLYHLSSIISHLSYLTSHISSLISHLSSLISHLSYLISHLVSVLHLDQITMEVVLQLPSKVYICT